MLKLYEVDPIVPFPFHESILLRGGKGEGEEAARLGENGIGTLRDNQ